MSFNFAWPFAFVLFPLPWLMWRFFPAARPGKRAALLVPFFDRLQALSSLSLRQARLYRFPLFWCLILIWLLLIMALAGPQWVGEPQNTAQRGRDIFLAVDLSGSMQTPDMVLNNQRVTRLDIVKEVANEFIQGRIGDRLGLILFGTRAYVQTPLTFDRAAVQAMLNDASIGLAGPQTAIGDALGLGIKRLLAYPHESRALVLLTDGGDNASTVSPIEAAKLAKQYGIKIYTIGLGATQLAVPGIFGSQLINPSSDLDIEGLKKMADITGGKFFRATDVDALRNVYQSINQLEPVAGKGETVRVTYPLYAYPLMLALLLSFVWALGFCWKKRSSRG